MRFLTASLLVVAVVTADALLQQRPRKPSPAYQDRRVAIKREPNARLRRDTNLKTLADGYARSDGSAGIQLKQDVYKSDNFKLAVQAGAHHVPHAGNAYNGGLEGTWYFGR